MVDEHEICFEFVGSCSSEGVRCGGGGEIDDNYSLAVIITLRAALRAVCAAHAAFELREFSFSPSAMVDEHEICFEFVGSCSSEGVRCGGGGEIDDNYSLAVIITLRAALRAVCAAHAAFELREFSFSPSAMVDEHEICFEFVGSCSSEGVRCGGGGEIRTLGRLSPSLVFKTSAFNRSATPPRQGQNLTLKDVLVQCVCGCLRRFSWLWGRS